MDLQPRPILHFWFEELTAEQHFVADTILGRTSTAEELAFLSEPGSSF